MELKFSDGTRVAIDPIAVEIAQRFLQNDIAIIRDLEYNVITKVRRCDYGFYVGKRSGG